MFENHRWGRAWGDLGARPRDALHAELVARYAEPGRFYHTSQHLGECFAVFDTGAHLAERPAEVVVALWFHDAVYDTRAQDNEEQSARWAERELIDSGATTAVAERVAALVLATRHAAVPEGADAKLLVDVDLSILGAPEARFAEYERQVRQEYGWVPEEAFRRGRSQVLRSFLERDAIYGTAWFAERLEAKARANLERSIRELGG
jgi:predicted metal-dependent HD superfamily phosphohydrolase